MLDFNCFFNFLNLPLKYMAYLKAVNLIALYRQVIHVYWEVSLCEWAQAKEPESYQASFFHCHENSMHLLL
jgi:hypothetical protein